MTSNHAMQETSLDAWHEIQPRLAQSQARVYALIAAATRQGMDMTNMEVARALGWSINRVTPRVKELRDDGHVYLWRVRRCGVTGRRAMAWRAHNATTTPTTVEVTLR